MPYVDIGRIDCLHTEKECLITSVGNEFFLEVSVPLSEYESAIYIHIYICMYLLRLF